MNSIAQLLLHECTEMTKHALASGTNVPTSVLETIAECEANGLHENPPNANALEEIPRLADAHRVLSELIAPATPRAITLFADQRKKFPRLCYFGPIPLVRWLMLLSFIFLICIIALASTQATNPDEQDPSNNWSIFNSSGSELLIRISFLFSSAGLGACFAALFRVNKTVTAGNYDPSTAISYWIRIVLGLIAGVILSEMVPLASPSLDATAKPVLALLGGFSATTLFRILNSMVQAVESVVAGDAREIVEVQQRAVQALSNQQLAQRQLDQLSTNSNDGDNKSPKS